MRGIVLVLAAGLPLLPVSLSGQCCIIVPDGENPTVVDEAPVPTNGEETLELLRRIGESAPSTWRGESVVAWVHVDTVGAVVETGVARSSGIPELDAVLLAVAQRMEFSPAKTGGAAVDVWLRFPVSLRTAQNRESTPQESTILRSPVQPPTARHGSPGPELPTICPTRRTSRAST